MPFNFLWNKIENIFLNLNFKIKQFIWGSNRIFHLSGQKGFLFLRAADESEKFFLSMTDICCVEAALIFDIYYLNLICALALLAIMAPSLPDVRSLNDVGLSSTGMEAHTGITNTVDTNQAIRMGLLTQ